MIFILKLINKFVYFKYKKNLLYNKMKGTYVRSMQVCTGDLYMLKRNFSTVEIFHKTLTL